jgi:hypothetical protein
MVLPGEIPEIQEMVFFGVSGRIPVLKLQLSAVVYVWLSMKNLLGGDEVSKGDTCPAACTPM